MSCIAGKLFENCESECLYQGEFLQLDNDLQYVRHARIFVMKDKICLASLSEDHEDVGCSNDCLEISRSSVNIDFIKNSPYTFKLNAENESNVYQLCDRQDLWPEFLRSFDLYDSNAGERGKRVLAKVHFGEMDDCISDSESECSSLSEGSSADDIGLPRCFTLCASQGLGAMSMYNVNNAMMMMNPGHVRRLNRDTHNRRGSLDFLGLPSSDSDESLRHANSYPQLRFNSKTERSRSLPNLAELDNVLVDEDLRYGSFNRPKRGQFCGFGTNRHKDNENPANFLSSVEYRTEYGKRHANNHRELYLNEQICKLIAQPSSIKFCNTAGKAQDKNESKLDPICESVAQENFEPVKVEQPKSRTYEVIDSTGGKFKLSFRKFWKRKEKLTVSKAGLKSDASAQQDDPEHVVFFNKLAMDYKVTSQPSYAVSSDRRGGLGSDASGKKEQVNVSQVTRRADGQSPAVVQAKEKIKLTPNSQPTFTGKDTIRKKIVKRILSPITILRSVSEEEKNISDLPQTASSECKSADATAVQARPKKLLDMNPLYLAQELCLIDKELLVRIPWIELSTCGWMTKHKYQRSPSVMEMVKFFNRIALLVSSEILFEVDPLMRVRVISKVIQVANKLRTMGNFNSLKALLAGLQCTPIYRLKETWKEVSTKRKKNFRDLTKLMSEEDNFAAYRNEVDNVMSQKAPCLPFLGDFLTQIAQTQTYLACRKKKSPEPPKNVTKESDASPTIPTPQPIEKQSSAHKAPSRTNLVKRRNTSNKVKDSRFSKSSPNLPMCCTRTPERTHRERAHRFRRCKSWQHSADSGIQVNTSNNSSLSASSNSFLTSNTSLGSGTFAFHSKNGPSEDRPATSRRDHGRSASTSTPLSVKSSMKFKLRRNKSVSEKCLSNSDNGTSLKTRLSFMRSFRRSKSMDQSPSSEESIQRLYSVRMENGSARKSMHEPETTDESGTELQLWHFHVAAIQYSFPSRPHIKEFLLSTAFNSEEDNYKLSLQREPATRKTAVS